MSKGCGYVLFDQICMYVHLTFMLVSVLGATVALVD